MAAPPDLWLYDRMESYSHRMPMLIPLGTPVFIFQQHKL